MRGTAEEKYEKMAKIFKSLSDPKRIKIIDVLSGGETCACVLLQHFQVTQPTLSHDMKLLMEADIVKRRRDGQRILYSLNMDMLKRMQGKLKNILKTDAVS